MGIWFVGKVITLSKVWGSDGEGLKWGVTRDLLSISTGEKALT